MAQGQEPKNDLQQENGAKARRTIPNQKVLSPLTYSLNLPATWRIHNVFHAYLLTPYVENKIHGSNYVRPPAELKEHEEAEWEVERIIGQEYHGLNTKI